MRNDRSGSGPDSLARRFSFWLLVGTVVGVGVFFWHIVRPLLLPLFLAVVLALLFWPVYDRMVAWCRGYRRAAAMLTTGAILMIVIVPIVAGLIVAGQQLVGVADDLFAAKSDAQTRELDQTVAELKDRLSGDEFSQFREKVLEGQRPTAAVPSPDQREAREALFVLEYDFLQDRVRERLRSVSVSDLLEPTTSHWFQQLKSTLSPYVSDETLDQLGRSISSAASRAITNLYEKTQSFIANTIAVSVGFAVMAVALYYFLADGPYFVERLKVLVPLENADEEALFRQFDDVCRGVVLGSVVAGLLQAALLGIGLTIAGIEHVLLLAGLTMVFALIPFLGAAGVYLPVGAYLLYQGRYGAAIFLVVYGAAIVSTSDNLIRAHVLHGRSRLHPLVGLVSMLGGLQFVGLWGIFIGPIVAGFFYGLVRILHQKLQQSDSQHRATWKSSETALGQPADPELVIPGR